jgi:hypothetical protein
MPRIVASSASVLLAALAMSQTVGASDAWTKLHRPLHLPRVAPDTACPVSRTDWRVGWSHIHIFGGSGIGRGPVYPGLGGSHGVLDALPDTQYGGPWAGAKVFWYIKRSYRGRVLIRGRQLSNAQPLGFNGDKFPAAKELRIETGDTASWKGRPYGSRGIASTLRMRSSGCYGVQIDGATFSRVVVFAVDIS